MKIICKDFEIVVMGDSGTGKTSIINMYISKKKYTLETIPSDDIHKTIVEKEHKFILKIWDIPGNEDYNKTGCLSQRNFHGCVLVYDVSNENSFKNLEKWYKEAKKILLEGAPVIILGNKYDLKKKYKLAKEKKKI